MMIAWKMLRLLIVIALVIAVPETKLGVFLGSFCAINAFLVLFSRDFAFRLPLISRGSKWGASAALGWLFMIVVTKKGKPLSRRLENHEMIHVLQARELTWPLFVIWYAVEYMLRRLFTDHRTAYRSLSFEQDARAYEFFDDYRQRRKPFSFLKYL